MIITIDGPAGTGKSTVAQAAAVALGFDFLDTGAMYRAIGLEAVRRGTRLDDVRELAFIARHCRIAFDWSRKPPGVLLNDEPVGHLLRGGDATAAASYVAVVPEIRRQLAQQQREIGLARPALVTEGRDQGTVVFPDAPLKFFLTADAPERARRRVAQQRARGEIVDFQQTLDAIVERDHRDSTRAIAPLVAPPGATVVDTTARSQEQVIDLIVTRAKALRGAPR